MNVVFISQQLTEGVLPVELPNLKMTTKSNDLLTVKRHLEPRKTQGLPISFVEPLLGGEDCIGKQKMTSGGTDADLDWELEQARLALAEAEKKSAERKMAKAKSMDDAIPIRKQQAPSTHPASPHPYNQWNFPPAPCSSHQLPVPAFALLNMAPSYAMSGPEWKNTNSGNVTYNVTTDCYNDNSTAITKRGMI